jgi:hypothetical protein
MISLPQAKDMLFLNQVVTDGCACRFTFGKRIVHGENNEINRVNLELEDFTSAEIDQYFNPTTLDPRRTQTFTAYYGNE